MSWRASLTDLSIFPSPDPTLQLLLQQLSEEKYASFLTHRPKAIAAVAYLKVTDIAGNNNVGFVLEKVKLAPDLRTQYPQTTTLCSSACR